MTNAVRTLAAHRTLGFGLAALTLLLDQAHKLTMLFWFNIMEGERWAVLPFLDIVLVWNRGISYGFLQGLDRWVLIGFKVVAVVGLSIWLWRCRGAMLASALGLIIGGAIGNGIDRLAYGAVADFFHLHWGAWSWYVFNIADCAIVIGVVLLIYDSFRGEPTNSPAPQ